MHESWSLPFLDLLKAGRRRGFLLNTNKPNCYTTLHSGSVSDATKPDNPNANPLDLLLLEFTAVFNEKALTRVISPPRRLTGRAQDCRHERRACKQR